MFVLDVFSCFVFLYSTLVFVSFLKTITRSMNVCPKIKCAYYYYFLLLFWAFFVVVSYKYVFVRSFFRSLALTFLIEFFVVKNKIVFVFFRSYFIKVSLKVKKVKNVCVLIYWKHKYVGMYLEVVKYTNRKNCSFVLNQDATTEREREICRLLYSILFLLKFD